METENCKEMLKDTWKNKDIRIVSINLDLNNITFKSVDGTQARTLEDVFKKKPGNFDIKALEIKCLELFTKDYFKL